MSINRNIVECKVIYHPLTPEQHSVLIETLWNVKEEIRNIQQSAIRINRNIVECKVAIKVLG